MFIRDPIQKLKKRLEEEPRRFIQVIYGPRQVGKTTLIQQFMDQSQVPTFFSTADAVPAGSGAWIRQQWESARLQLQQQEGGEIILILDEIQKINNWSEFVKKEWDRDGREDRPIKVVLLGSSRLLLQQGLTESLAGRFEAIYMGHWTFREMHEAFGFSAEEYVWFGGYPGAAALIHEESRWKDYVANALVETSISKDILMLTRIGKPALMKRLFELGCRYSGQILSFNKILGQLQDAGNTTTLSHYLDLLNQAGLLAGLEKYSPNRLRQRASSPKFQVHNTSLLTVQETDTFQEVRRDGRRWGRWVESAIGAHLLNAAIAEGFSLHYWRARTNEVDFVLENKGKVVGIEVKLDYALGTKGLAVFQQQFDPYRTVLVEQGGFSWKQFLRLDPASLFD